MSTYEIIREGLRYAESDHGRCSDCCAPWDDFNTKDPITHFTGCRVKAAIDALDAHAEKSISAMTWSLQPI